MSISRFGSERIVRAAFEYAREHGRSKVTAAHQANIFFFQAEDGIRDIGVTGVQTCALPIFPTAREGLPTVWEGSSHSVGRPPHRDRKSVV